MASPRRTNVSEPLTPILGRAELVDRAHALLDGGTRWLTFLGTAGVGKSRLLCAVAAGVPPRESPGGVWRCSLAGASTEREICGRIGEVLASQTDGKAVSLPEDAARLVDLLRAAGAMTLALDDAERGASWLANFLPPTLAALPGLRVLVGSRQRLGGPGETVLLVEPLEAPAAAALFVERAEAARGTPLREEERSLVPELVRRLDALPLALELAAAQLAVLSARELLDSLERSAIAGADGEAPRTEGDTHDTGWHRSLHAALDVSWSLLDDGLKESLCSLALFEDLLPDLASMQKVLPAGSDAAAQLTALGDRSWLRIERDPEGNRYRLLAVTRTYVRRRTPEDAARRARYMSCVAAHAARHIERWGQRESMVALCGMGADLGRALDMATDPATAVALGIVLGRVASIRGPVGATLDRLDRVFTLVQDATPSELVDLLLVRGRLHARDADPARSRADFQRALELASQVGDASREAQAASHLADHLRHHGEPALAETHYRRTLAVVADLELRARVTASLAGLVAERAGLTEAGVLYEEALVCARAAGADLLEAMSLQNLGLLVQEEGDLVRAEALYRKALARHVALGHRRYEAIAYLDLAALALERGRMPEAKSEAETACALAAAAGDQREVALAHVLLAVAFACLDDDDAAAMFVRAASLVQPLREPGLEQALEKHEGHLLLMRARREPAAAQSLFQAVEQLCNDTGEGDDARLATRILAGALERARGARDALRVARDGAWFEPPGSPRVDLSTRAQLHGVVATLAAAWMRDPKEEVPAEDLIAAGWRAQRSATKAAKNRLHVALATLRKLGLAAHLKRGPGGYRLVAAIVDANG